MECACSAGQCALFRPCCCAFRSRVVIYTPSACCLLFVFFIGLGLRQKVSPTPLGGYQLFLWAHVGVRLTFSRELAPACVPACLSLHHKGQGCLGHACNLGGSVGGSAAIMRYQPLPIQHNRCLLIICVCQTRGVTENCRSYLAGARGARRRWVRVRVPRILCSARNIGLCCLSCLYVCRALVCKHL